MASPSTSIDGSLTASSTVTFSLPTGIVIGANGTVSTNGTGIPGDGISDGSPSEGSYILVSVSRLN